MANDVRGEVALKAGDQTFTLKFSTNAVCEAENICRKSVVAVMREIDWVSTRRVLLWAALQENHKGLSIEDAGAVMDKAGQKQTVAALIDAFNLAFPQPDDADEDAGESP